MVEVDRPSDFRWFLKVSIILMVEVVFLKVVESISFDGSESISLV